MPFLTSFACVLEKQLCPGGWLCQCHPGPASLPVPSVVPLSGSDTRKQMITNRTPTPSARSLAAYMRNGARRLILLARSLARSPLTCGFTSYGHSSSSSPRARRSPPSSPPPRTESAAARRSCSALPGTRSSVGPSEKEERKKEGKSPRRFSLGFAASLCLLLVRVPRQTESADLKLL